MGLVGLEPTTPALSRRCSNQLSYRPFTFNCESSKVLVTSARRRSAEMELQPAHVSHTVFNYSR